MTDDVARHIAWVRAIAEQRGGLIEHCISPDCSNPPCRTLAKTLDLLEAEHERAERLAAAIRGHKMAYTGQHTNGPEDMRQKREATRALYAALEAQEEHRG